MENATTFLIVFIVGFAILAGVLIYKSEKSKDRY